MKNKMASENIIDIHSHILPGLDDGARNMEETLQMLAVAQAEGITHMVATPHFKLGRHNASVQTLQMRLAEVKQAALQKNIYIDLFLGNEILFDSEIEKALETEEALTMNQTDFVLVEFSPGDRYIYIRNAIDAVMGMGYRPVLAHGERYECMLEDIGHVVQLRQMGAQIQINAASIMGEVGRKVKIFSHQLLRKGLVDYVATDAHRGRGRTPAIQKCREFLYKKYDTEYVDGLLCKNAQRNFGIG